MAIEWHHTDSISIADSPSLFLQCFAAGAVAGPHRRDHSYQLIVSSVHTAIFNHVHHIVSLVCECLFSLLG